LSITTWPKGGAKKQAQTLKNEDQSFVFLGLDYQFCDKKNDAQNLGMKRVRGHVYWEG